MPVEYGKCLRPGLVLVVIAAVALVKERLLHFSAHPDLQSLTLTQICNRGVNWQAFVTLFEIGSKIS